MPAGTVWSTALSGTYVLQQADLNSHCDPHASSNGIDQKLAGKDHDTSATQNI
jgi:hypothetical protein